MYTNLFPLIDSYTLERGNLIYIFSKACSVPYTSISSPDIQMEDSNITFVSKYLAPDRQMDSNIAPTDNITGKCLPQKRERCSLKYPQFIGDGTIIKQCKTCNHLVGVETLICDKCEEAFHISFLEEKLEQEDIDSWYWPTCQAYISQIEPPEYQRKFRIGSRYQAEVPQDSPDMSMFLGVALPENGWKVTNWQPAESIPANVEQNWLQCKRIVYMKGEICPDGRMAKKDIRCGKWRRAHLGQIQTERWDCSSAVLWDPACADYGEPQVTPSKTYQ